MTTQTYTRRLLEVPEEFRRRSSEGSTSQGVVFVDFKSAPGLGRHDIFILAEEPYREYIEAFFRGISAEASRKVQWRLRGDAELASTQFVSLVKAIPAVRAVHLSFEGELAHIWTYLDARPFDTEVRYKIYEAEEEIIGQFSETDIDFHLVNLSEYPAEAQAIYQLEGDPVYQRPD